MKTIREAPIRRLVGLMGAAMAAFCVGIHVCSAASVDTAPVSWVENPADSPAECTVGGDGAVTVAFGPEPQPPNGVPRLAGVLADYGVPNSPFGGDYLAARIRGVRFRISWQGKPPFAYLVLRGPTRNWYGPIVSLSETPGQSLTNNLTLDIRDGWLTRRKDDTPENMWTSDLTGVTWIGVAMQATNDEAQAYAVDSFVLVGDNGVVGPAANLAPVQRQILLERFGVLTFDHVLADQKTTDADKDGMTDYQEAVVGTDWKNAQDALKALLDTGAAAGIAIRWRCVAGGIYNILSADDLAGQFSVLELNSTRDFAPTAEEEGSGYMTRTDLRPIGAGPRFYKVVKK